MRDVNTERGLTEYVRLSYFCTPYTLNFWYSVCVLIIVNLSFTRCLVLRLILTNLWSFYHFPALSPLRPGGYGRIN